MSSFSRKKHSEAQAPSTSESAASGIASSQVLQLPTDSQSHLQSPQEKQQSQPDHRLSAHAPPFEHRSEVFPRCFHSLSTSTATGELFLFGGQSRSSQATNDLHVISMRDFSTTLLKTSGDIPSPRYGHCAVFASISTLLIWGGTNTYGGRVLDDSLYLFNLVWREWTRIVVNGPGPRGRYCHSMTLIGSQLFIFGGRKCQNKYFNDIWAMDLNCLRSNPSWESYEPAPGNEKPLPRAGHVSVATGDSIIIFGGYGGKGTWFNDTWSFNISTRKWTKLQCTGSIPHPRTGHAAILIDDLMYVFGGFGGRTIKVTALGDLTTFNLSTQQWITFQDIGPSPSRRYRHAMACDGTRIFVLGGFLSHREQVDETKPIHVLETKHLDYPKPDSDVINPSEKTAQLVWKSSVSLSTRGKPHQPPSSLSDAHAVHREEPDHSTSQKITRERNPSLNDLPSRSTGTSSGPRRVPGKDDSKNSTEHHTQLEALDVPSGERISRLEPERLIELEQQLSEILAAKTDRDRRIVQLTDELTQKSALLAQAMDEKKHTRQEVHKLQAKLDESLLSRDHALEQADANAEEEKRRAALEQRELQVKLDRLLLSLDQAEANIAEVKKHAELEQRKLQAKLDESILSRDEHLRMLEQAQSDLQIATPRDADADERSQPACGHETELAELRAELEGKKSELAAVRLRLTGAENGWAKGKANADRIRIHTSVTAANLIDLNEDRTMCDMEGEMESLKWNEKSVEEMECLNEG